MNVQPDELSPREFYRILIHCIAPRPIGWISSLSKDGVPNLAPFSFFNALSATPPLLGFCSGTRSHAMQGAMGTAVKDTLRNVHETGEFVANMVSYELREAMILTSGEYDASVNEFEVAELTMQPSSRVRPPRVKESPVGFECKVVQILHFGTEAVGSSLVIGEILSVHLEEAVLREGRLDPQRLEPVGRLGGIQYCRTRERFEMVRPEVGQKPRRESAEKP